MFSSVFRGNSQVKVKVKRIGSFSFLIERGQQDGKDISHNSDTGGKGGISSERINEVTWTKGTASTKVVVKQVEWLLYLVVPDIIQWVREER